MEKTCSVLDMEDSGIQQIVQLFIKIWVIPTQQRHILLFKKKYEGVDVDQRLAFEMLLILTNYVHG